MKHLINVGRSLSVLSFVVKRGEVAISSSSSSWLLTKRAYATKKSAQLTEAQILFQKHTAELGFKEKTSIRGTLYEFHDVETSIKYMNSEAFKIAYGDKLIWQWYIRNHKGRFPRLATRLECVGRDGRYIAGNPCPICRDPYLVVNYRNLDLLRQFVSPDTGYLLPSRITNVCQRSHENLMVAYEKACDHGLIDHPIPHRSYDYRLYTNMEDKSDEIEKPSVLLGLILGANRKGVNKIYEQLSEEDIIISNQAKK